MQLKKFAGLVVLSLIAALGAGAQTAPAGSAGAPPDSSQKQQTPPPPQTSSQPRTTPAPDQAQPETHITQQQAKELFASVGTILQFASDDSKLPIKREVKSKLITRPDVEKYLVDKLNDDKDAKRMEREEIVLKKFGLIDPDFQLRPFLVKLLDEQIAAFYDSKTKMVNLLDWIDPATQKPVMAHELTHALQDQRVNLDKWEDQTSDDLSHTYTDDLKHVSTDEDDTARDAVLEGQAMAVFVDYSLQPLHRTLRNSPEMIENLVENMADDSSSPVLTRAPLLLQESLLFPYKDGLKFEATLLTDSKDPSAAFAGVLDRPPASSYEVMNPHAYERQAKIPLLRMPDVHPVIDAQYSPYDIGVMGELDVRILAELFGGNQAAAELTPEWDGGIYYAAQKKNSADKNSTSSVALLYLSQWKSEDAAADFVKMYSDELGHKYKKVTRDTADETGENEQIYQTNEGPVLIVTNNNDVFISESFDLNVARKLQLLMLSAQKDSGAQVASERTPSNDLSGSMVRFMAGCGVMKAALPRH